MGENDYGRLIYLGLLIAATGGWVLVEYRSCLGQALRVAMAWGLIFVAVMAAFGLWSDIRRDILPGQTVTEGGEIIVPQAEDGHYYLRLDVNGKSILFLADTGASNIVLTQADAASLGIDLNSLSFFSEAQTANGTVRTARVKLDQVVAGPFQDANVAAYVNQGEMDVSLLGMDYLGQFQMSIGDGQMKLAR